MDAPKDVIPPFYRVHGRETGRDCDRVRPTNSKTQETVVGTKAKRTDVRARRLRDNSRLKQEEWNSKIAKQFEEGRSDCL